MVTSTSARSQPSFGSAPSQRIRTRRRRRNYFIEPETQRRIMRHVLAIVVTGIALGAFNVLLIDHYAGFLNETFGAVSEAGVKVLVAVGLYLLLWLALSYATVHLLLMVFSHRIAGPEYRLRRVLEAVRGGDLGIHVRLRKNDFLQDLAGEVNLTVRKFKHWSEELERTSHALRAAVDEGKRAEVEAALAGLEALLRDVRTDGSESGTTEAAPRPSQPVEEPRAVLELGDGALPSL